MIWQPITGRVCAGMLVLALCCLACNHGKSSSPPSDPTSDCLFTGRWAGLFWEGDGGAPPPIGQSGGVPARLTIYFWSGTAYGLPVSGHGAFLDIEGRDLADTSDCDQYCPSEIEGDYEVRFLATPIGAWPYDYDRVRVYLDWDQEADVLQGVVETGYDAHWYSPGGAFTTYSSILLARVEDG